MGLGIGVELQVIAAAVIGGTSFAGGIGTIPGAVLGAVVMQSLQSGMVLLKIDTAMQDVVVGDGARGRGRLRHRPSPSQRIATRRRRMTTNGPAAPAAPVPLVEMRNMRVSFGGVHAVDGVSVDLYPGEVVGLVGGNGAGKSTLIRALSGAHPADEGEILIDGRRVSIANPRDAKDLGIETIYQTLALADNGTPRRTCSWAVRSRRALGLLDDAAMESATREVMGRLNPKFRNFKVPVKSLSGGQRQSVAIARAVHFNARILIMDEPTAALGPAETAQVRELVAQLKAEGIGIFLISHDIHDVFDLADRISVMLQGRLVGTVDKHKVTKDEVLAMIIIGKLPERGLRDRDGRPDRLTAHREERPGRRVPP